MLGGDVMNERMDTLSAPRKGVAKKQIASLIDAEIIDRLDNYVNKCGYGSKRIIIENALITFLDKLDKN